MAKTPTSALAGIPEYEQHPLALELMPGGMAPDEFESFCDDVQERGILFHITLYEGKVLDGWHRYRAAHRTGTAFKTVEYTGSDPAGYIASCNIHRRKLTSLQRALFAARVHLRNGVSQRDICKRYSISNTVLSMVLKAIDSRNAMVIKRIENDSEYTRGMLREELEEAGLVHANYGKSAAPTPNSVFAMGDAAKDTEGTGPENPEDPDGDDDEDLIGNDDPLPTVGKRPSHPERRVKDTPAQRMKESFQALMYDEKSTFVQMLWADLRPIAEELGLPGLVATQVATTTVSKAKRKAKTDA